MKIQIGNRDYELYYVDYIEGRIKYLIDKWFFHQINLGRIHHGVESGNYWIKVKKKNQKGIKRTLYHEVSHGIFFHLSKEYPIASSLNNNEQFIEDFSKVLMTCCNIKKKYTSKHHNIYKNKIIRNKKNKEVF
jgi:hypothetical protein